MSKLRLMIEKGMSMTENEAIEEVKFNMSRIGLNENTAKRVTEARDIAIQALEEIQQYRAIGTIEEILNTFNTQQLKIASQHNELEEYKAIGTVDEFKVLKEKKNVLPIATIKISKEDMQKMVDEKVAQTELDIQEIRAKAIDEFAKWCYVNGIDFSYMRKSTDIEPFVKTVIKRFNKEQMKAGGKNE